LGVGMNRERSFGGGCDRRRRRLNVADGSEVEEVETRRGALTGGQQVQARWILGALLTVNAFKNGGARYEVPDLERWDVGAEGSAPALTHSAARNLPMAVELGLTDLRRGGAHELPGA
jgi:hypothetical protein